jgi:hypothetical protein
MASNIKGSRRIKMQESYWRVDTNKKGQYRRRSKQRYDIDTEFKLLNECVIIQKDSNYFLYYKHSRKPFIPNVNKEIIWIVTPATEHNSDNAFIVWNSGDNDWDSHSDPLLGGDIISAGNIIFESNNKIKTIMNKSGHYLPDTGSMKIVAKMFDIPFKTSKIFKKFKQKKTKHSKFEKIFFDRLTKSHTKENINRRKQPTKTKYSQSRISKRGPVSILYKQRKMSGRKGALSGVRKTRIVGKK